MNPPPEVGSTTAGVKEEETHLAGAPIAPPPPRFSSPPAVMPVTAAVAAAKAVAAEMLAAPIAETPGREWRVDAMDADPRATARDVHRALHVLPRWTTDENDGRVAAGDGAFGAGATGASSSFASARDDAPVDAFPLPLGDPSPPPAAVDPALCPPPPLTVEEVDAAWAAMSARPMDASIDGLLAASESWVACDEESCGKWRRVPAVVALRISDTEPWYCRHSRDVRHDSCAAPQELCDDEIDRRVNAAAALQLRAAIEAGKRKRKQELDRQYRERKKARLAAERREARIAAGLPPDSPPRPPKKEPREGAPKREKGPPGGVKAKREPPPPPPPPPPRFYPESCVRCEAAGCGKWRRVPRRVAAAIGPRDRWVCHFDANVPAEERDAFPCERPCEWATDGDRIAWIAEQKRKEAEARANGAEIDGDPPPESTDGTPDGTPEKAHKGRGGGRPAAPPPEFANAEEEAEWRRRKHEERTGVHLMTKEEAGIREDLPRGTVSGYAAEQMTEEDEDEHEPGGRTDGEPRTMPPPRPRGQPAAAVPAVCGGVDGVYLARRAMFRCMCGPDLENCAAKSGEGDGVVLTTTAFERHCGMEKSKNWRNSCSVTCAGGQKVKIGIWLDEVGIDVARGKGGGGGGGPGSRAPPKDHKAPKEPKGPIKDTRWQPRRPGPFDNLPLRRVMTVLELVMDTEGDSPGDGRRAIARAGTVCKAWLCAAQAVVKARGAERWCPEIERTAGAEEEGEAGKGEAGEAKNAEATANGGSGDGPARLSVGSAAPRPMDHVALKHPGAQAVDRRVKVFWPEENEWFTGIVSKHDPSTDKHTVTYDDGDVEEITLAKEKMEWLDPAPEPAPEGQVPPSPPDEKKKKKTGTHHVKWTTEADYTATRAQLEEIYDYVPRGDPEEVARERAVTLAPDHPRRGENGAIGSPRANPKKKPGRKSPMDHVALKHPGAQAVDRRVKVFWPEENEWFTGIVSKHDPSTDKHTVTYDDGDVEEITLAKEKMEWLEPGGDSLRPASAATVVSTNGDVHDPSKPPGWWPSVTTWPIVKGEERRHKVMGVEVQEQETFGVDYVTGRDVIRCLRTVLPEYSEDELWEVSDSLMVQVNATYGPMPPELAATQNIALAAEDLAEKLERLSDAHSCAVAKALWRLAAKARLTPDMFAVHRKGFGVVCHPSNKRGIKAGELVVDFLGEMYPPWAWQAKQDAIKTVQRIRGMRESGPPEFYNMQLERPAGDAEGFSILFVDAMHHNNYAARLSHSCDPNVEVSLKAIDGKYCINFYAKRDVKAGEELCYNYHSCTDSMKEVEAAFCLCGARGCRASYLAFVGEQGNSHVLKRCHRLVERQAALLAAGDAAAGSIPTPDAVAAMEEVGLKLGRGLLRDVPTWLTHYVAHCALYMKREVAKLPRHILDDHRKTVEKELAKSKGGWKPPPFGLGDAEIEAMAVRENRLQSMAICLSRVRYMLGRGPEKLPFASAPPPARPLTAREVAEKMFGPKDSMVQGLLQAMKPHARSAKDDDDHSAEVRHAEFNALVEQIARESTEPENDPEKSLKSGLIRLRDALASMPSTPSARHDVAAELVHLHAHTRRYWSVRRGDHHGAFTAEEIPVRENEVNSFGIGAEGASEQIVKQVRPEYKAGTAGGALLVWYKQEMSDPLQWVNANRRGCVIVPDLSCAYSPRPGVAVAKCGAREREAWLAHLAEHPEDPWPQHTGPWGPANAQRLIGSPVLDAFMAAHEAGWGTRFGGGRDEEDEPGRPRLDPDVLTWLLDRKHPE